MPKQRFDFSSVAEDTFTTIDGRELQIKDYFGEKDFVVGEESDGIFIKHVALLRALKKLFRVNRYHAYINQEPKKDNEWCATVGVCYDISPKNVEGVPADAEYSWTSVADCNRINSMPGFEKYTTTVAETRASARALRNILGIDFCSKEEVADGTNEIEEDGPIQNHQRVLLETKFMGEMKVSIEDMAKIINKPLNTLDDLTRSQAALLIDKLNSKRTKRKEDKE